MESGSEKCFLSVTTLENTHQNAPKRTAQSGLVQVPSKWTDLTESMTLKFKIKLSFPSSSEQYSVDLLTSREVSLTEETFSSTPSSIFAPLGLRGDDGARAASVSTVRFASLPPALLSSTMAKSWDGTAAVAAGE